MTSRSGSSAAAVRLAAGVVGVAALFLLTAPPEAAGETDAAATVKMLASPHSSPASAEERAIEITVSDGRAEVYREGSRLGSTPYTVNARLGERVRLTLRREGYADEPVDFTVGEKRAYMFTMSR